MQIKPGKIECINPNTGRKMNIDRDIYELFSKAIYHVLKNSRQGMGFSDLVKGVKECLKKQNASFSGSIDWYAITVKYDMEANGLIEVCTVKGKKLNALRSVSGARK